MPGLNLQRRIHVQPRLRVVHIGAGTGARCQRLACRVELGRVRRALGQHQGQLLMGQHGFKIGATDAHRQILLILCQRSFRVLHLRLGLPVLRCKVAAKQGLAYRQGSVQARVMGLAGLLLPQ